MYADRYIHRIEAPNGQALYYLSTEEDAFVTAQDVNFDGVDDLVVFSARGASNAWVLFFVWDGNAYVRATWDAGEDTGLPNYELLPEDGLLLASCDDGLAGSAVSEMDQETAIDAQAGTIVTTVRNNRMSVRVTEPDGQGGYRVLWEGIVTEEQAANDPQAFSQEEAAFWQGFSRSPIL